MRIAAPCWHGIDPSFVITHKAPLADAPALYTTFRDKQDGCIKVVLKPWPAPERPAAGRSPFRAKTTREPTLEERTP